MIRLELVLAPLSTRLARARRFEAAREARAEALRASAELAGAPRDLPFADWPRAASGAPQPARGWFAAAADTIGLVVGLVSRVPAAVDAEWRLRPRLEAARARFQADGDLARLSDGSAGESADDVLSLWTAKEALLKLAGVGLADLGRCPLVSREADERGASFVLAHRGRERAVRVERRGEHWIACACAEPAELALSTLQGVA